MFTLVMTGRAITLLMLRSTELNTFSMTKPIYRDLVCRANGGIYRLSGKTMNVLIMHFKTLWLEYITKPMNKHKFND